MTQPTEEKYTCIDILISYSRIINHYGNDVELELIIDDNMLNDEGDKQYIRLYGPTSEGTLIDITRIEVASDIDNAMDSNEKVTEGYIRALAILSAKMQTQLDVYWVLGDAIRNYNKVKEWYDTVISKAVFQDEEIGTVQSSWSAFNDIYDWVQLNNNIVSYEESIMLINRPHKLHRRSFDMLVDKCIESHAIPILAGFLVDQ